MASEKLFRNTLRPVLCKSAVVMRNLPKSTFRKKIRNELFEILSKSDDYLEITEIMHQLKFN